jgi:hypothetical protein
MREWGASAGGCTFVFRATYFPWLVLACAVALLGIIGLRVAFVRWRRGNATTGGPKSPTGLAGAGLTALSIAGVIASTGCQSVKLDESFRSDVLFQPLIIACGCAFAVGVALLVVSVLQLVLYRGMPRMVLLPWGIGSVLASMVCPPLALLQVVELGRVYLPVIEVPSPVGFHVGLARHARPKLFRPMESGRRFPLDDPGWSVDDVVFEAASPGVVERTATARQGRFTVSAKVTAKAHRDAGSPWFPLHIGNEWHYALTTTSQLDGTRYMLVFTGSSSDANVKTGEIVVKIEPAAARDGWREYTLVVKSASGDAVGQHVLRPIDDETYYYEPSSQSGDDPPDEPEPTNPKCALQVLLDVDPGSEPERGCRMANMGAGRCQSGGTAMEVLPPPIASSSPKKMPGRTSSKAAPLVPVVVPTSYALAGPSHLSTHWEVHGGAGTWIVGILTAGFVIPTGASGGEEYVLTRTVRGPGG